MLLIAAITPLITGKELRIEVISVIGDITIGCISIIGIYVGTIIGGKKKD